MFASFLLTLLTYMQYTRSKVYETVGRPSVCLPVRPSVCPIQPPHAAAVGLLLWASRARDIDRLLCGHRSAANASSATLSANVGS